jgi:DNA modification methylase
MTEKIKCLGKEFKSEDERREYFRNELRMKLPELKKIEGFPIGEDEDIITLSDPPYYTACPNPWLSNFIAEWEKEKGKIRNRENDFHVNSPYAFDVKSGRNSSIYNAHSYHTKVPHEVIMRYILHYTQPGDIMIDSFGGTGMAGVAATICGKPDKETKYIIEQEFKTNGLKLPNWGKRNCINSDLSPIASHISSVYNNENILPILDEVEGLLANLEKELSYLYETKVNGKTKKINYLVWSSVIVCESCNKTSNYFDIAYSHDRLTNFERLENVTCPHCKFVKESRALPIFFTTKYDQISKETDRTAKLNLSLVNYYENKSKKLKLANKDDEKVNEETIQALNDNIIPAIKNPGGVNLGQPLKSHGYKYLYQFYPERTLLVIDRFLKLSKDIKSNIPLFILTSALPKLTKLNRYMPEHGGRALVGPRANTLYIPPLFVENNAIEQIKYQFEKIAKAIQVDGKNVIQTSSATKINLPNNSIDYIFTDPPFGGNIMYSELNLLSESWLKLITNNKKEAITNDFQSKTVIEYQDIMVDCFKEYFRVLKPGKWITVEFSNRSAVVWNAIQYSLRKSGFLIVSVDILDKERPGFVGMIGPNAVKEDLAITCFKPNSKTESVQIGDNAESVIWSITQEIIENSAIINIKDNKSSNVISRDPRVLWDRVVSNYLVNGFNIPIDLNKFQEGLKQRFSERDGMYFTADQAAEYDEKKAKTPEFVQLSLIVTNESDAIEWLKDRLRKKSEKYQDIMPDFRIATQSLRKGDTLPELQDILNESFIQDADGKWRTPNPNEAKDREALRNKALLKDFNVYVTEINKPKAKKLKEVRVEALRSGFKNCWEQKDFKTIVELGDKIPQNILLEDEQLLMYYDIAKDKV